MLHICYIANAALKTVFWWWRWPMLYDSTLPIGDRCVFSMFRRNELASWAERQSNDSEFCRLKER